MNNVECVPVLWKGNGLDFTDQLKNDLLKCKSCLGHQAGFEKIEGIVVKNYKKFYEVAETHSMYGHFMCTKIVNDDYKEVKKIKVPKAGANIDHLIETLRSEPRWHKAVIHLRERNELKGELSDLGLLVREVMNDIEKEEKETLKEELWKLFRKDLLQGSTKGIQQYYKDLLVKGNE